MIKELDGLVLDTGDIGFGSYRLKVEVKEKKGLYEIIIDEDTLNYFNKDDDIKDVIKELEKYRDRLSIDDTVRQITDLIHHIEREYLW